MKERLEVARAEVALHFDNPPDDYSMGLLEYMQTMDAWICELHRLLNNLYLVTMLADEADAAADAEATS